MAKSIVTGTKVEPTVNRKTVVSIPCPNCEKPITLGADRVGQGDKVICGSCSQKTYWPADPPRPFYKRREWWIGLLGAFALGVSVNASWDFIKGLFK